MTDARIVFTVNERTSDPVATAAIHFNTGLLAGLRLEGFTIWKSRLGEWSVTLPARTYTVNGERRSYTLLRANNCVNPFAADALCQAILTKWRTRDTGTTNGEINETRT